ncbi:MAG: CPBP family intramembrane metalloprotease [Oscillospiraceae bacterium]|nr:CPBP family intramembrane metalloprotease [Oscillospiraceae bacterium]
MDNENTPVLIEAGAVKRQASRTNLSYGLLILLSQLCGTGLDLLVRAAAPELRMLSAYRFLLSGVSFYLIGGILLALTLRKIPAAAPEKQSVSAKELIIYIVMAWGLMMVGNILGNLTNSLLGALTGHSSSNYVASSIMGSSLLPTFIFAVITGPVFEEIFFRKLLCDRFGIAGGIAASVMSGLIFGLFHGNLYQFFYAFLIGALMAQLYVRTGKLRYTIIIHMAVNFLGSFLPMLLIQRTGLDLNALTSGTITQEQLPALAVYGVFAILQYALAITGIVLLVTRIKTLAWQVPGWRVEKGSRLNTLVLNTGGVFLLAVSVAIMAYTFLAA